MELRNKSVALLGYGVENKALLPYLQEQGAIITICDKNEELTDLPDGIATRLGESYLDSLTDFDIVFRSPGLPYLSKPIQAGRQAGVVVNSQTKLFLEECPAQIIGVTGTKGKGTTSSLIHAMLTAAAEKGKLPGKTYIAGNIGTPPVGLLGQLTAEDWVVLEMSSFQLQDVTISPTIAVVLNVTIDHLDHHRDEAEYISAKKNIARYQKPTDSLVVNLDSLTSTLFADESPAHTYFYSRQKSVDDGAFVERELGDDRIVLRLPGWGEQVVCQAKEVKLVGEYNLENVTAAITAAALAGADMESIREGATTFTGLAHRLQFVAEVDGVSYYDDSKATTPDSTAAAVLAFQQPLVLIVGGSSKGADFTELVQAIVGSSATTVICIGQEGKRIQEMLMDYQAPQEIIEGGQSMTEIVAQAQAAAQSGGVVLLSPAAASFDMFANAEDRGNQFQTAVKSLM
jgi:UDP-N-acetylmuramoylalanine--D-glutamate ligase